MRGTHDDSAHNNFTSFAADNNNFEWTHEELEGLRLYVEAATASEDMTNDGLFSANFDPNFMAAPSMGGYGTNAHGQGNLVVSSDGDGNLAG